MKSFIKRIRNISLVFVLLIWQVVFAGAPLLGNAHANPPANPAANLDQCRNGSLASPAQCIDSGGSLGWVNGNAGASDSHWREGDSLAYRMLFSGLSTSGSHSVTIQWDTIQNGKHALDYLTSFNRTETTADPCSGVASCGSPPTTYLIPSDSNVTSSDVTQIPGVFTLYNGTITSVTGYTLTTKNNDASESITINFTASDSSPVLAWGGHIASQVDWGFGNSAGAISGSSYHTRLLDLDGSGGNQDRSLSAAAVFPTPTITTQASSANVHVGDNVTDTATLTGPSSPLTGTIDFFVCGPDTNTNPDCTTGGTQVGGDTSITVVTPAGNNTDAQSNATSSAFNVPAAGNYCFRAEYTPAPDAPYSPQNHTDLNTECFNATPKPSTLTVVKDVVNDNGGTLTADKFDVKVNGTQLIGGVLSNNNLTDTYTYSNPQAGTPYTVSEDSPTSSGYSQTSLVCKDNDTKATVDNPVTLDPGQNVTCTITNDDVAPQLTVIKHVINDNGGLKLASDFTMDVTGINVSDTSFAGAESPGTTVTLNAGSYSVDEGSHDGYAETKSADCSGAISVGETKTCTITNNDIAPSLTVYKDVINAYGGTTLQPSDFPISVDSTQITIGVPTTQFNAGSHTITETQQNGYQFTGVSGDCTYNNSTISLSMDIGGTYTCTLTNTAIQPKLTVIKHVINNNGGGKSASDFTMTVDNSASVPNFPGDENGTTVGLNVGSYSVDETSHDGYAESFSGDCSGTIALGDTKTCTITNDDIAPSLTLNKVVSNTHGGTGQPSDWTLTATGPTTLSGKGPTVSSDSTFSAGTYTLSESGGPSGYSASSWDCTNGVIPVNNEITLDNGQTTSCTITNSDIAPTLTVTKVVENPFGTALDPSAFPLYVDGISVTTGVPTTQFGAGSHTVTETQQPGYTLKGVSGDCSQTNGTISLTLEIGGSSTCTLTNTAIQPELTVVKHVINDNSGTKSASNFTMTVSGNSIGTLSFPGDESGTTVGLNEGDYTVDESSHVGYAETFSGDCDSSISIGETKTCTITNNDIPNPGIHIVKSGPSVAHEGDNVTYTFTVTNTGDIALSDVAINDNVAGGANYVSGDTNHNDLLDTNETWIFTKDYTIPTPQVADVVNTAQACGDYSDGTTSGTDVCDTDMHDLDVIHPAIQVEKFGPATAFQGQTVAYTFWVTNTGDTELHNVGIADDLATGETCNDNDLAAGDSTFCTATYTIPNNQTGDVTNHVTASGTDQLDETVTGTDQHTLTVLVPGIHVVKTGPSSAAAGSTVTYTFTVTNTGNTPLDSITVNDDIAGAGVYQSGDTNSNDQLDTSETWIYTANYTIPKDQFNSVTNTVTVCGTANNQQEEELQISDTQLDDNSKTVCAQDSHTLVIPKVLAAVTPPKVLANTGQSAWAGVVAGLTMLSLVLGINIAFGRQAKKQR